MQHTLRTQVIVSVFLLFSAAARALNPPPANDSAWTAANLGVLPFPGICPANPIGDSIVVNGTTLWASSNAYDFSPVSCSPAASPDVWYRFIPTGSQLSVNGIGFNGLDTFFVRLWSSQGGPFALVPLQCQNSTNSTLSAVFMTTDPGSEYYLQVGGNQANKTGDFTLKLRSFNSCNECVKQASVELAPAPWFGHYGTGETVTMCMTVDRWDFVGSADIHGIVPRFGSDWDPASLTPVQAPQTASNASASNWHWFTNVPTPDGPGSGYFYDGDGNGNPSDNPGDSGSYLSSWTGCWKITSVASCNTNDLSVQLFTYSDAQTGTGNAAFACQPSPQQELSLAGWCCPGPVTTTAATGCNTGLVTVSGALLSHTYNFTVYNSSFGVVGYASNVTTTWTFGPLPAGTYLVESYDQTDGCNTFAAVEIEPLFEVDLVQTSAGCGSGTATVEANPDNGTAPFSYLFLNLPLSQQQDSLAWQVPDGWLRVQATDATGCVAYDSILINSMPAPDATFNYPNQAICSTTDTVHVSVPPSPGGMFTLVSPLSSGITVDATTGDIFLSASTATPPYYVTVKYGVGTLCTDSYADSVQVTSPPQAPQTAGSGFQSYCIGSPAPQLTVTVPAFSTALWYDNQTTQSAFGTTFTPPLGATTLPGTYIYGVVSVPLANPTCTSTPLLFVISALSPPAITVSNDTTICPGETAALSVSPCSNCAYSWTPAPTIGSNVTAATSTSPASTTTYTVTATDQSGCSSSLFTSVFVNEGGSCVLHVYSGFTPNGDGHNDQWIIDGIDQVPDPVVSIYNRWGKRVWETNGYDNSAVVWNGNDENGNRLPDGTYYYVILAGKYRFHGWVELSH